MKVKDLLKLTALTCMAALVISDCGVPRDAPTVQETIPVTQPAETIPQETEPPVEAGPWVTADGDSMESGSILLDGTVYVKVREFLTALDRGVCAESDANGFVLEWEGQILRFRPGYCGVRVYRNALWVPLEDTCEMLNLSILKDEEQGRLYCTSGILNTEIPADIRVPVLMYHAVDSQIWGHRELFVTPEVMEAHLKFLLDNGYDPIFFEDLHRADQYDKPVILTFDDGYRNNYTELFPLLQKYQVKATIFIVTSSIGSKETSMTAEQVKELSDSGLVSIQSHTVNHRVLRGLPAEEQRLEMEQSKLLVTRMTGREPFVISYPTGVFDANTLPLAQEFYRYGVIVLRGDYITGTDPWTIRRYNVRDTTTMDDLALMLCDAGEPG